LLFLLLVMVYSVDQIETVQNQLTHIDRLKGVQVGGSLPGINEVFEVPKLDVGITGLTMRIPNWDGRMVGSDGDQRSRCAY
jgi:hypothetical protein